MKHEPGLRAISIALQTARSNAARGDEPCPGYKETLKAFIASLENSIAFLHADAAGRNTIPPEPTPSVCPCMPDCSARAVHPKTPATRKRKPRAVKEDR